MNLLQLIKNLVARKKSLPETPEFSLPDEYSESQNSYPDDDEDWDDEEDEDGWDDDWDDDETEWEEVDDDDDDIDDDNKVSENLEELVKSAFDKTFSRFLEDYALPTGNLSLLDNAAAYLAVIADLEDDNGWFQTIITRLMDNTCTPQEIEAVNTPDGNALFWELIRNASPQLPWRGTLYEKLLAVQKDLESQDLSNDADYQRFVGIFGIPELALSYTVIKKYSGIGSQPSELTEDDTPLSLPASSLPSLQGKKFVVTGTLTQFTRAEVTNFIQQAGGTVLGSISKNCDYLVVGDKPGSKLAKAQELGIPIITEDELAKMAGSV